MEGSCARDVGVRAAATAAAYDGTAVPPEPSLQRPRRCPCCTWSLWARAGQQDRPEPWPVVRTTPPATNTNPVSRPLVPTPCSIVSLLFRFLFYSPVLLRHSLCTMLCWEQPGVRRGSVGCWVCLFHWCSPDPGKEPQDGDLLGPLGDRLELRLHWPPDLHKPLLWLGATDISSLLESESVQKQSPIVLESSDYFLSHAQRRGWKLSLRGSLGETVTV